VTFIAKAHRLSAELHWSTATEVHNYGFGIERRTVDSWLASNPPSSHDWKEIGFELGAGTSNAPRQYHFLDRDLKPGRYAYRLRQIDNDGTVNYYGDVEIEIGLAPRAFVLEQNYPNPFNSESRVDFTLPADGRAIVLVYNAIGQEIKTIYDAEVMGGRLYQVVFDGSNLPSGTYFYRLVFESKDGRGSARQDLTKRMILVK